MPNKYEIIIENGQVSISLEKPITPYDAAGGRLSGTQLYLFPAFPADNAIIDLYDNEKAAGLRQPYTGDIESVSYLANADKISALIDRYAAGNYLKEFSRIKGEFGLSLSDAVKDDIYFYHNCECILDSVAAVLHYYASIGKKVKRCAHCGKAFYPVARNGKEKYCTRKSPMDQDKTCENAVDAVLKRHDYRIKKWRARTYDKANKFNPCYDENDKRWQEHDKATIWVDDRKKEARYNPTPENLQAFDTLIARQLDEAGITDERHKV